jgi:hypothetical protein
MMETASSWVVADLGDEVWAYEQMKLLAMNFLVVSDGIRPWIYRSYWAAMSMVISRSSRSNAFFLLFSPLNNFKNVVILSVGLGCVALGSGGVNFHTTLSSGEISWLLPFVPGVFDMSSERGILCDIGVTGFFRPRSIVDSWFGSGTAVVGW